MKNICVLAMLIAAAIAQSPFRLKRHIRGLGGPLGYYGSHRFQYGNHGFSVGRRFRGFHGFHGGNDRLSSGIFGLRGGIHRFHGFRGLGTFVGHRFGFGGFDDFDFDGGFGSDGDFLDGDESFFGGFDDDFGDYYGEFDGDDGGFGFDDGGFGGDDGGFGGDD